MPTVGVPTFEPLTLKVNWKVLPQAWMYEILSLPSRVEELQRHIAETWEFDEPPEYTGFFWARQHGYAVSGLEVSALAQRLREHAALPVVPVQSGDWNRDDMLCIQRDKLNRERKTYEALIARQPNGA
jgi:hypothetical protein